MISDQYRCIFVHIPRVAGTSIELAITGLDWWNTLHLPGVLAAQMENIEPGKIVLNEKAEFIKNLVDFHPKHRSAEDICMYHGHQWKGYFTFAFVRNPWDRLVSLHKSLEDVLVQCNPQGTTRSPWQKFIIACFNKRGYIDRNNEMVNFSVFVRRYQPMPWETRHKTQVGFLQEKEGFAKLDFIGHFENIEEDFEFVCNKINFPSARLQKGISSGRGPYRDYYDSATRDLVAQEYTEDIETFNYEF